MMPQGIIPVRGSPPSSIIESMINAKSSGEILLPLLYVLFRQHTSKL